MRFVIQVATKAFGRCEPRLSSAARLIEALQVGDTQPKLQLRISTAARRNYGAIAPRRTITRKPFENPRTRAHTRNGLWADACAHIITMHFLVASLEYDSLGSSERAMSHISAKI